MVIIKQRLKEEQRLKRIYKKNIDLMKSLDQQIEEEEDLHEEPYRVCHITSPPAINGP